MAYIKMIEEEYATGELIEVYEKIKKERGKLSNILKIHSLLPNTMLTHLDFYMSIMFSKSGIRRADKELIATVVSAANKCEYCVNHHAEALRAYWKNKDKVDLVAKDFRQVDLPEETMAVLEYAEKLTLHPGEMTENDIKQLRAFQFSDEQILSINLIINYFNFVNRMANGLGVDFTEEEMKGYKY